MVRSKLAFVVLPLVLALAAVGCGGAPEAEYDEQGQPLATREHVAAAASVADEVMGVRERLVGRNDQITDAVTTREHVLRVNDQITDAVTTREHILRVNDQITDAVTQ